MYASRINAHGASSSGKVRGVAGGPVELPLHIKEKMLCSISSLESAHHTTICMAWTATVFARLARPITHLFACMSPDNRYDRHGLVVSVLLDGDEAARLTTMILACVRSLDTNGQRCIDTTPSGRVAFTTQWWSEDVVLIKPITGMLQRIHVGEPCLDPGYSRVLAAGDSFFAVDGYKLKLWQRQADNGGEGWTSCAMATTSNPTKNILSAINCSACFYPLHQNGCMSIVDATVPPPLCMEKLPVESLVTDQFGSVEVCNPYFPRYY